MLKEITCYADGINVRPWLVGRLLAVHVDSNDDSLSRLKYFCSLYSLTKPTKCNQINVFIFVLR